MRVLIVEDERKIADFVRKGLTEHGYAVDVAYDGEEALDWPSVADFDVIVLDVMLPVRDGIEVCRVLRDRGVRTPILILTAGADSLYSANALCIAMAHSNASGLTP